jgi:uncharacterized protein YqgC (DUF456 family)
MTIVAGVAVGLASLIGAAMTLVTLPGLWFLLGVAMLCQWLVEPAPYSWWTLGAAAGLGVAGEVIDVAASAVGAGRAGGGRSGAWMSILGAFVGAVAGSLAVPIIGSIIGAVLGAGLGAVVGERGIAGRSWAHSARVGGGAAAGRLVAMFFKCGLTLAAGVLLTVAAFVP